MFAARDILYSVGNQIGVGKEAGDLNTCLVSIIGGDVYITLMNHIIQQFGFFSVCVWGGGGEWEGEGRRRGEVGERAGELSNCLLHVVLL